VRVEVPGQQQQLKEKQSGVPDGCGATKPGKNELRYKRLNLKQ
jgi:hypothetical protein